MNVYSVEDGSALGERFRDGALDVVDVIEQALRHAVTPEAADVFITLTGERAIREAEDARARHAAGRPLGLLDGVPVAVKDLFDVAGTVTTAGSRTRTTAAPATRDAHVVRRLAEAGMVCVGKTNLSEFAFSGLGVNPHFGTPANPGSGEERLVPGGSSSGSAVAVALGIVPIAMGTDTSGSVRVPAAFCGVTGFKASEDRYGKAGLLPLSSTLDSIGIIARSVRDIIAADAALLASTPAPAGGPYRLVLPSGPLLEGCSPHVRRHFEASVAHLVRHGVAVEERDLPVLTEAQALMDEHATIVEAEAYQRYGRLLEGGDLVDRGVLRRLARHAARHPGAADPVRRAMRNLRTELHRQLGDALLVCPTVRHTPPPLVPLLTDDDRYDETNRRTLRTTMLLSYLGMPGVTLPIGTPGAGQVGLLVSAASGRDLAVLETAHRIEDLLESLQ
ncbi:amidase family protein [Actinocorallia sp. B10E7]|uniref:amidase family protein n=1 Tax=Actinocorallia sp. B10E7 TaxID=3153558 RepID=UPI00325C39E8